MGLLALTLILLGLPLPSEAATGPEVRLVVPQTGGEVSGSVDVVFDVLDVGGPVLHGATVSIGPVSRHQDVDPQSCPIACELQTTLDVGDLDDGPRTVTIDLELDGGDRTTAFPVTIHNAPTIDVSAEVESGLLAGQESAEVQVFVTAHAGARPDRVVWDDGRGPRSFAAVHDPDGPPGRTWRTTVESASLPEGPHRGTVTATDDRGRLSTRTVTFVVIHDVELGLTPDWPGTVDDLAAQQIDLSYRYAPAVHDAYPATVALAVDGRTVAVDTSLDLRDVSPQDNAGVARAETTHRLAPGRHQVSLTVTDNRGVQRVLARQVTVTPTLTATWLSGAGATVVDGDVLPLRARVVTAPGFELLDCRYTMGEGRTTSPALCSPQADGSWVVKADVFLQRFGSPVTVTLQLTPSRGTTATLATSIRVLPRLSARVTEAAATAGRRFTLVGEVTGASTTPGGATVELQRRSGTRWKTVGTTRTRAGKPEIRFRTSTTRSTDYRLVPRPKKNGWGAAAGPERHLRVISTLQVIRKPRSATAKKPFSIRASTLPSDRGVLLQLQEYRPDIGEWVSVANATTAKGGTVTFTHRIRATTVLRVYRESTDAAIGSTSRSFTVKVG